MSLRERNVGRADRGQVVVRFSVFFGMVSAYDSLAIYRLVWGVMVDSITSEEKKTEPLTSYRSVDVVERLLSDIVHKIKNNLAGIGGFAALLAKDLESGDPHGRLVQRIQDGVVQLNEFVVDLMTLVRVAKPRFKKVRLQSLVREVWLRYWGEERGDRGLVFHPSHEGQQVEWMADSQMAQQMLFHAIRFTDLVGGEVETMRVRLSDDGGVNFELSFLDGAIGHSVWENVVELVDDCEPVDARLSLAIVLKMVGLHGGELSIASIADNRKMLTIQLTKGS